MPYIRTINRQLAYSFCLFSCFVSLCLLGLFAKSNALILTTFDRIARYLYSTLHTYIHIGIHSIHTRYFLREFNGAQEL